jgi:hypothetical protein
MRVFLHERVDARAFAIDERIVPVARSLAGLSRSCVSTHRLVSITALMIAQQRLHNPLRLDLLAICSVYRHVRLRVCLNVNFLDVDAVDAGPLTPTKQGVGLVEGIGLLPQVDPRGLEYHWLRVQRGARENSADFETAVVAAGRVSVTPIYFDRTDEGAFAVRAYAVCFCFCFRFRWHPRFVSVLHALPLCGAAPTFLCRRKEK